MESGDQQSDAALIEETHSTHLTWDNYLLLLFGFIINPVLLFCGAGRLDWIVGDVYVVVSTIVGLIYVVVLAQKNPALLKKRLSFPVVAGQPGSDRLFIAFLMPLWLILPFFVGLDAVRFGWTPKFPIPLIAAFYVPYLTGVIITLISCLENPFASPAVHVQDGHRVVSTGIYSLVRHPMYLGGIIAMISMGPILNSFVAMGVSGLAIIQILVRIELEERFLRENLAGYREYCQVVKKRVIPYIY